MMIHTLAQILIALGAVLTFAGALALAFGTSDDGETTTGKWVDAFLCCGIFSLIRGFARSVSDAVYKRSGSHVIALALFLIGLLVLAAGLILR